ncbi:MAG: hypothetical protein R6V58_10535 [Planctomycetota bacterium]
MAGKKRKKDKKPNAEEHTLDLFVEPYADPGDKLSGCVQEVGKPLLELAQTNEQYERAMVAACCGWNCALLSPQQEKALIEEMCRDDELDYPVDTREELGKVFRRVALRKRMLYPDDQRMVLNWQVKFTEYGARLNVLSGEP